MKLLEFKRLTIDGEPYKDNDACDWFVQFETDEEWALYNEAISYYGKDPDDFPENRAWNDGYGAGIIRGMLTTGLQKTMTDDDIYFYFAPFDTVPKVGDKYELDNDVWERVA